MRSFCPSCSYWARGILILAKRSPARAAGSFVSHATARSDTRASRAPQSAPERIYGVRMQGRKAALDLMGGELRPFLGFADFSLLAFGELLAIEPLEICQSFSKRGILLTWASPCIERWRIR